MTDIIDPIADADLVVFPKSDDSGEYDCQQASFWFDHLGGVHHTVFPVLVPSDWSLERAKAAIRYWIEPQHCTHSYDCCGHYYGKSVDVIGEDYYKGDQKVVWARRTYIQNV